MLAGIRKSLEQSTSLNPNFAEGYAYLANVQMQGRDSTAAVDAARRAELTDVADTSVRRLARDVRPVEVQDVLAGLGVQKADVAGEFTTNQHFAAHDIGDALQRIVEHDREVIRSAHVAPCQHHIADLSIMSWYPKRIRPLSPSGDMPFSLNERSA